MKTKRQRHFIAILALLAATLFFLWSKLPMTDPAEYFHFADKRDLLSVKNAMDVLSNLIFLYVGVIGIVRTYKTSLSIPPTLKYLTYVMSFALIWTCFGSMYFHLNPNPETLFWDRLPMTIAFSAIVSLLIAERVSLTIANYIAPLLFLYGIFSIWGYREEILSLRPYLALQFGAIIFVVLTLIGLKSKWIANRHIVWMIVFYILAKFLELRDAAIYESLGFISGHSLKHIAAGIAVLLFLNYLKHPKKKGA